MTKTHTKNNPLTDAALAELDRLFDRRRECNKDAAKWAQSMSICYQPLRQRLTDAESRLAEAEREREGLRSEIGKRNDSLSGNYWLAARDAKQRREGAVMKLLDMSLSGLAWDETSLRHEAEAMLCDAGERSRYESMLEAAQRLREGK